jgi:hypothetical protein
MEKKKKKSVVSSLILSYPGWTMAFTDAETMNLFAREVERGISLED